MKRSVDPRPRPPHLKGLRFPFNDFVQVARRGALPQGVAGAWPLGREEPQEVAVVQSKTAPARDAVIKDDGVAVLGNTIRVPLDETESRLGAQRLLLCALCEAGNLDDQRV
jgi:hypothetical protein